MLIDWFTVGAQALNFLILVGLLRHFLYRPILHAIDTREKLIAAELADAAAKKAEARKERDEFQRKNAEFDQQRAALLGKATDEAKAERGRLLEEARKAADALRASRQATLENDAHNLNQAIARRTQQEVFAIARKALTDLATTSLEERVGEVFNRRLREMNGDAKKTLGAALKGTTEPAVVRSAFDLPANQRAAIQNAVNETFSADIHLRFETASDLVSGIELTANGQKVAWSIADYLASLEKGVGELLKQQDTPEPKAAPKPEAKAASEIKTTPTPAAEAGSKTGSPAEVATAPKPAPKIEAKAPPNSDPAPEPKKTLETQAKPKPEIPVAPQPEAKASVEPEKEEAKAAPKPETKATPEIKTTPKPAAEAGSKTEPPAEVAATPKPAAKIEAKAPPDSDAETEPKKILEAQAKLKPEIPVASQPEAKASVEPEPEEANAAPVAP